MILNQDDKDQMTEYKIFQNTNILKEKNNDLTSKYQ